MNAFETKPETARGRAIYRLLLGVHAAIRSDLQRVEELADQAVDGLPAQELREGLDEVKRDGMLWRLRMHCLYYCRFVHSHHGAEDYAFFPELREANPALSRVVDRLEADHRQVSDDLDAVEAAANALLEDDSRQARQAVADALRVLADRLLEHLDFEERNLEATVLRLP